MATSFGPETPVLSYGPRGHANPGGRNDRVWMLWPAWAFRVIAPEFRRRPLQRAPEGGPRRAAGEPDHCGPSWVSVSASIPNSRRSWSLSCKPRVG